MEFALSLETLNGLLAHASSVTADSSLREEDKGIILKVQEGGSTAIARNSEVFVRVPFEPLSVKDYGSLQVSSSMLSRILATFSGLSRTKVSEVRFRTHGSTVQVLITEEPVSEEFEGLGDVSSYTLDNIKIKERTSQETALVMPEEGREVVSSESLGIILDSLLPTMDSKRASNNNMIHFAEDYVFVVGLRGRTFFSNPLEGVMKDSSFRYSSVAYLRKLSELGDLEVAKVDGRLAFKVGDIELFIQHIGVRFSYQEIISKITKEHGIVVDRIFLKDILRRMSVMGSDLKLEIGSEDLILQTDGFERNFPIFNQKGDVEGVNFKIKIAQLQSMIIGDDSVMSDQLFIYIDRVAGKVGYSVTVSDGTGSFLATTSVA